MDKVFILVPTRGKRKSLYELMESYVATRSQYGYTQMLLIIDPDEKELYKDIINTYFDSIDCVILDKKYDMAPKLNIVAQGVVRGDFGGCLGIGFMGDDHYFVDARWENAMYYQIQEFKGLCYFNDLLKGEELPTSVFIHKDIINKLGFMCPHVLNHYYIDNYWKDLGIRIDNIKYYGNIVIEHRHHSNKKNPIDDLYRETEKKCFEADHLAYDKYVNEGRLAEDAWKILKPVEN